MAATPITKRKGAARRTLEQSILPTLDALRQQGCAYQKIADALGVSYVTIYRAVNRLGPYKGLA